MIRLDYETAHSCVLRPTRSAATNGDSWRFPGYSGNQTSSGSLTSGQGEASAWRSNTSIVPRNSGLVGDLHQAHVSRLGAVQPSDEKQEMCGPFGEFSPLGGEQLDQPSRRDWKDKVGSYMLNAYAWREMPPPETRDETTDETNASQLVSPACLLCTRWIAVNSVWVTVVMVENTKAKSPYR